MQFERRRCDPPATMIACRRRRPIVLLLAVAAACMPPSWGADVLLHPTRKPITKQPNIPFDAVALEGAGATLRGWWFHTAQKRGTVVVLHGTGDNRVSALGSADHFTARGFDVVAYDSRAHGESGGDMCTYGFYEKQDLKRVLDRVEVQPIVVMGFSMGAAIALQAAAEDARIRAVIAVSAFSDLRTAVLQRTPLYASEGNIAAAFRLAEERAKFRIDDVSPMAAAARIQAPTLVIHGDHDGETPREHAERIFAALRAPKRLIMVPSAGHNHVLDANGWREIDGWLDTVLTGHAPG